MAEPEMLRWTLEEIIGAVGAEIDPPTPAKIGLKPVRLYAFVKLSLASRKVARRLYKRTFCCG
jgi:hypothetical protein